MRSILQNRIFGFAWLPCLSIHHDRTLLLSALFFI
jgi:hypothetical protein